MGRTRRGRTRRVEAAFGWLAQRAGKFVFFSLVASMVYASAYHVVFDTAPAGEGSPFGFTLLLMLGLGAVIASFITAGRKRGGRWPTMPIVAFSYLFAIAMVRILLGIVDGIAILPDVPDTLIFATRAGTFWMVFVVGWILAYGTPRGWNRVEVDPWPFRWLFWSPPPPASGEVGGDEERQDS